MIPMEAWRQWKQKSFPSNGMTLPDSAITEFQALYKAELGVELSIKEATERASKIIRLFSLICEPLPVDEANDKRDI